MGARERNTEGAADRAPVDGAANEALIALLAEHFGLPRRAISIVRGATGRQKTLEIVGLTPEMLEK